MYLDVIGMVKINSKNTGKTVYYIRFHKLESN